jgi:predicted DNA-binding transcriptional regulator AlpA
MSAKTKGHAGIAKKAKPQPVWLRRPLPALDTPPPEAILAAQAPLRLLDRDQVCEIVNVTFPTLWAWMRSGKFPRSRVAGAKSMWLSTDVEAWMRTLPMRRLKGDTDVEAAS